MHAFQLRASIEHFLASQPRYAPFLEAVDLLAASAKALFELLDGITAKADAANLAVTQMHTHLARLGKVLNQVNHRKFFKAHETFQSDLEDLMLVSDQGPAPATAWDDELNEKIEEFIELYDAFLSDQTPTKALPVLKAAHRLQVTLETSFKLLEAVRQVLSSDEVQREGEAAFSLYLPSEMSLRDFVSRLSAFQALYSKLCELHGVSELDRPLRIAEVESGSLWLKVFGDTKVIATLTSLIERGVGWSFRNYTREGKLGAVPLKVDSIDAVLGLTKRLREEGVDVSAAQENIRLATVALSKDLEILIRGQTSVTVNQERISLQEEIANQQLELMRVPTIEFDKSGLSELGPKSLKFDEFSRSKLPPPTGS